MYVWWEEVEEGKKSQCERGSGKLTKLLRVGGDIFGDEQFAVTKRKCSKTRRRLA